MPKKGVITRKAALRKAFQEEFEETEGLVQELELLDVKGQGDLATEIGKWVMKSENSQEVVEKGTFMVLWKKEEGKWKTLWETWNSSSPAEE